MSLLFLILMSVPSFADICIDGAELRNYPKARLTILDCQQNNEPVSCETLPARLAAYMAKVEEQSSGVLNYLSDVSKWTVCAHADLKKLEGGEATIPLDRFTVLATGAREMDSVNRDLGCSQAFLYSELVRINEAVNNPECLATVQPRKPAQKKQRSKGN
jgi:hypothetical protein